MRYNLSEIMRRAWALYRKYKVAFSEALHRAWAVAKAEPVNAERVQMAAAAAGITQTVNTWAGWKSLGFEVVHGSRAVFQTVLIYASKGDGATYTASFFTAEQVQAIA